MKSFYTGYEFRISCITFALSQRGALLRSAEFRGEFNRAEIKPIEPGQVMLLRDGSARKVFQIYKATNEMKLR
ncbi:MAG: hypothetical protein ACR2MM_12770 [Flavobacteriaceae bacterium]